MRLTARTVSHRSAAITSKGVLHRRDTVSEEQGLNFEIRMEILTGKRLLCQTAGVQCLGNHFRKERLN